MISQMLWAPGALVILAALAFIVPPVHVQWILRLAIAYLVAALLAIWIGVFHPVDALATWFFMAVDLFSAIGIWYSGPYIIREAQLHGWSSVKIRTYHSLFLLFIASLVSLSLWSNFLFLWVAIEACTLSSAVLVAVPENASALEASWKYVLVTEIGGLAALVGTILALTAAGYPLFGWGFHGSLSSHPSLSPQWALIGAYMALVGFGAKAGLAPFHTWLPDAHSEAPAPVSALLSGLKLAGAVLLIYRLFGIVTHVVPSFYLSDGLIILGLFSLIIAAGFLAFQNDLKRLWAYSSIEHIGLISLGMGFGGIALIGAILHIWTHGVTKTLLFHNAGTVRLLYHNSNSALGTRGILQQTPWTGGLLAVGSAAIIGLPPFAPFWSEWLILAGGFHTVAHRPAVYLAAGLLVIIFIAIARRLPEWLFVPGKIDTGKKPRIHEPLSLVAPSLVLGILVVASGIGLPLLAHPLWHHLVIQLGSVKI